MKQEPIAESIDLVALAAAPLADALNLNVPLGKRVIKRGPRHAHYDNIGAEKLTGKQVQERRENEFSAKLCSVLDYYAGTTVPIDRVAEHTGLTVEQAKSAMERRGRTI